VELDDQKSGFRMSCRDKGRGFDVRAAAANGERAERIGARFYCASSADKGTDVQVIVPAHRAYVRGRAFRFFSSGRSAT
jgi:signal transduction histidine kinase